MTLTDWQAETQAILADIAADGFIMTETYALEHHFSSTHFATLEKLAIALFEQGFEVTDAEEVELEDGTALFCFDAIVDRTLTLEPIMADITTVLPLCTKFKADYDGWGVDLGDEEEEV